MPPSPPPLEVTEEQVLFFRARRGHLAGRGAPGVVAAAGAILGAQSQQLPPSLLALSLRTAGRPAATEIKERLLGPGRELVRTWGQRDTLHVYDPTDWADVVAARKRWAPGGRRGVVPSEELLDTVREILKQAGGKVTRKDLFEVLPASYVAEAAARIGSGRPALQLAAARPLWVLANRGELCLAEKAGAEQAYASRSLWFPDLPWLLPPALAAAARLARRYLAVYGPASAADIAHFFGARVGEVRGWLEVLAASRRRRANVNQSALIPVRCGAREGLLALDGDAGDLATEPPAASGGWPLRLLPLWESMLMAHADKSWTVPDEAERKLIWRKAGYVAATVLARGRIVATWKHKPRRRHLAVDVQPLGAWDAGEHAGGVQLEAESVARHFGLEGAEVKVGF